MSFPVFGICYNVPGIHYCPVSFFFLHVTFRYLTGVYFTCAMLLVSMSCLMTVVVLNLHFKGSSGKKIPLYLKRVFSFLATIVCFKIRINDPTELKSALKEVNSSIRRIFFYYQKTNNNLEFIIKLFHTNKVKHAQNTNGKCSFFFLAKGDASRQQSIRTHQWEYLGRVKA